MLASKDFDIVTISQLVRVKRLLDIIPNFIRMLSALTLALLVFSAFFGGLLRIIVIIAAGTYVGGGLASHSILHLPFIPFFIFDLFAFGLMLAIPLWLLSRINNDSTAAIIVSIVVCLVGCYFLFQYRSDSEEVAWLGLCVLLLAIMNFGFHLGYLAYLEQSRFRGAVIAPSGHTRLLAFKLSPKSGLLFLSTWLRFVIRIYWLLVLLLIVGFLIWLPIFLFGILLELGAITVLILFFVFIAVRRKIGSRILGEVRRLRAEMQRTAPEILRLDNRKCVLLLRSFIDDSVETRSVAGKVVAVIFDVDFDKVRLEECLVDTVCKIGPVVGLSSPGRNVPVLGAARDSAEGDWKELVSKYLEQSQLIVAMYGEGEGLFWEIDEIIRRGYRNKLILVAPPHKWNISSKVLDTFLLGGWEANSKHLHTHLFVDGSEAQVPGGERVLAVTEDRASGRAVAVTARFNDAMAYTMAMKYCLNLHQPSLLAQ
jgi:hypothetical protein